MCGTLDTFLLRFPEFDDADPVRIEFWLAEADSELSQAAWGSCYCAAVETLAAHYLSLELQRSASSGGTTPPVSGSVASASADGLSVSFATPQAATGTASGAGYARTPYGLDYMGLMERCLSRARLARCRGH